MLARIATGILLLASAPACIEVASAADPGPSPAFERSCRVPTECPGRKCIELGVNAQGLSGVCSARCADDADCGDGSACFQFDEAGPSCLSLCDERRACAGGLVCARVGSDGERACFVTAAGAPGA